MRKKITYFNNEERNGIFLLTSIILIFCIFIFVQKRILPNHSSISIHLAELESDNTELYAASFSNSSLNFSNNSRDYKKESTSEIPVKKIQKVESPTLELEHSENSLKIEKSMNPIKAEKQKKIFPKVKSFKKKFNKKPSKIKPFNLNSQDPEEWKQIRGIGDGFSSRIIKYQNWLGGFYSVNQLNEVYGLSDSMVQVIIPHLQNTQNFKKIAVNTADVKAFGKHPYLEWKDANNIIKYRKHNFPITKDSFKMMMGLSKETKTKILPYLDFSVTHEKNESEETQNDEIKQKSVLSKDTLIRKVSTNELDSLKPKETTTTDAWE